MMISPKAQTPPMRMTGLSTMRRMMGKSKIKNKTNTSKKRDLMTILMVVNLVLRTLRTLSSRSKIIVRTAKVLIVSKEVSCNENLCGIFSLLKTRPSLLLGEQSTRRN